MKSNYKELLEELKSRAQQDGVPLETLEQDYAISFLLKAMSESSYLSGKLVFRGGTALRKCYFVSYRYSMDLDYSVRGSLPKDNFDEALMDVAKEAERLLKEAHAGMNFSVSVKMVRSRDEHSDNQDSHKFLLKFPWHMEQRNPERAGRTINLDTSHSEPVVLETEHKRVIHGYRRTLNSTVVCLSLDELLAEKLVAIKGVQTLREQGERQSTRPRDYYDFEHVICERGLADKENFLKAVVIKADRRGIELTSIKELFSDQAVAALERDWKPFLSRVVPDLADCRTTVRKIEAKLHELFPDFSRSIVHCREGLKG